MSGWSLNWKMAFRSLGRNRRRSFITLLALSLSVLFVLMVMGFHSGLEMQSANNLIELDYGHLKILPESYDPAAPAFDTLMVLSDFPDSLIRLNGVEGIAPRLKFQALLSDGLDRFPCLGIGLGDDQDRTVFDLMNVELQGRFWREGERGMVVGSKVAQTFQIDPDSLQGKELTLLGRSFLGAIGAFDLPVLGVISTGYPAIDLSGVLLPISLAQELLSAPGQVSEITLRLADPEKIEQTVTKLGQVLSAADRKVKAFTWKDLAQDFLAIHRMKTVGMTIMVLLFVLIAIIGVTNAVMIAAFERNREVGMLRALGLKPGEIMRQFLSEGAVLGLVGSMVGSVLGTAVNLYFQAHGLNLTAMYGEMEMGYPIKDYLYTHFSAWHLVVTIGATTLLSALAAYLPARRTCRFSPSEALRSQ